MPSMQGSSASKCPSELERANLVIKGGPIELEQLGSTNPPLGGHRLHSDRHCQLHCTGTRSRDASALGYLLAAAPARLPPVQRPVLVPAALRRQVAWRGKNIKSPRPSQRQPTSG